MTNVIFHFILIDKAYLIVLLHLTILKSWLFFQIMSKFLFSDGANGVKEVQSLVDLEMLIKSTTHPDNISIWVFSSNEWISLEVFRKQFPKSNRMDKQAPINLPLQTTGSLHAKDNKKWVKRMFYFLGAAAGIFLVFNFTKIDWVKASPVNISASRPANVPPMDIDSLIREIEYTRGQQIDRNSKANLRLRNSWPDRIMLRLNAERENSKSGSRFFNFLISIDNTTGYNIDNAVVTLSVWKNEQLAHLDTFRFDNILYNKLSKRYPDVRYKGDSIAVSFQSINAKAFNFCYSVSTKNISGNDNDRWFCRN